MNQFEEFSEAAFDASLSVMGEDVKIRGKVRRAIVDTIAAAEALEAGGAVPSSLVSVTIKQEAPLENMNVGEHVTVRGREVVVRQITTDETTMTLICDHLNKR